MKACGITTNGVYSLCDYLSEEGKQLEDLNLSIA